MTYVLTHRKNLSTDKGMVRWYKVADKGITRSGG